MTYRPSDRLLQANAALVHFRETHPESLPPAIAGEEVRQGEGQQVMPGRRENRAVSARPREEEGGGRNGDGQE